MRRVGSITTDIIADGISIQYRMLLMRQVIPFMVVLIL